MKNKHLSYDDRLIIEKGLYEKKSFKHIARDIKKDCTTIAKEVKRNIIQKNESKLGRPFIDCIYRKDCKMKEKGIACTSDNCSNYKYEICPTLLEVPYVCNACQKRVFCHKRKRFYYTFDAQKKYEKVISDSRKGITFSEQEINNINYILIPLIVNQGQSIHHAVINNKNKLMISEKEIYNLIDSNILNIKNIDLPRKVRYRARKKKGTSYKVDKQCLNGRRYSDFQKYLLQNPDTNIVEIDSVIGSVGGKCLLTIHFVNCSFMIAFLRDHNDAQSVIDIFNLINNLIGLDAFKKLFDVILTDNGSEFSNPLAIEVDPITDEKRTQVFYCEPGKANQKGACEVNHELIRRILPQSTSFDNLSQKDINIMMSNINSYKRHKLNDKSPFDFFCVMYGKDITRKLGIVEIPPNDINISQSLLCK